MTRKRPTTPPPIETTTPAPIETPDPPAIEAPDPAATTAESSPATSDDGAHLDAIRMPEIEGDDREDGDGPQEVGEDGAPIDAGPEEPELIDRDAFWIVFQTAFNMPGMLLPDLRPLAIQPAEQGGARAASDATYALLEIYAPGILLPGSETLAHLMVAGPFFLGKAFVVREIIRARKAKPIEEARRAREAKAERPRPEGSADPEPNTAGADTYMPPQNPWAPDESAEVAA